MLTTRRNTYCLFIRPANSDFETEEKSASTKQDAGDYHEQ